MTMRPRFGSESDAPPLALSMLYDPLTIRHRLQSSFVQHVTSVGLSPIRQARLVPWNCIWVFPTKLLTLHEQVAIEHEAGTHL